MGDRKEEFDIILEVTCRSYLDKCPQDKTCKQCVVRCIEGFRGYKVKSIKDASTPKDNFLHWFFEKYSDELTDYVRDNWDVIFLD